MKPIGEALRAAGALSTVGLAFVVAIVIGFWAGSWLDGRLGTKPVLTYIGFAMGLAAGLLNVYRIVSQALSSGPPGPPPAGGGGDAEPRA